jgi:hypothetical protein
MILAPITLRAAAAFIAKHHRHCAAPKGWKFGISLRGPRGGLLGVVVVARPVARMLDNGYTAEITRLCTPRLGGRKNACSKLYAAARRAAFAMGYRKIVTYTLDEESGTSLLAAGFIPVAESGGGTWNRPSRNRVDAGPLGAKIRWESTAA